MNHRAIKILALFAAVNPIFGHADTMPSKTDNGALNETRVGIDFGLGGTDGAILNGAGPSLAVLIRQKNLYVYGVRLTSYGGLGGNASELTALAGLTYEYNPVMVSVAMGYGSFGEHNALASISDTGFNYDLRWVIKVSAGFGIGLGYARYLNSEKLPRTRTLIFSWTPRG